VVLFGEFFASAMLVAVAQHTTDPQHIAITTRRTVTTLEIM